MFLDGSRYAKVATDTVTTADGREATAIRLRRLPQPAGALREVIEGDRLDVIAERAFGDATRTWHITDANTALEARDLVAVVADSFVLPRG